MTKSDNEKHPLDAEKRPFAEDERVEKTKVDPQSTDIFDETLRGTTGNAKSGEGRSVAEKVADEVIEEKDEEEEWEEDDNAENEEDNDDVAEEKAGNQKKSGENEENAEEADEEISEEEKKEGRNVSEAMEEIEDKEAKKKAKKKHDEETEGKEQEDEGGKKEEGKKKAGEIREEETQEEEDDFEDWDQAAFDRDYDAKEPKELKAPGHEEIRKTMLSKAAEFGEGDIAQYDLQAEKLSFLSDPAKKSVFIGRKASLFKKYGYEAALHIGRVQEKEFENNEVFLDSLNPHVVFVCGARGSGKCLTGDTLITLDNGEAIPIKELESRQEKVFALGNSLEILAVPRAGFFKRTVGKTLKVKLRSGKEIELTHEHPLLTVNGWVPAENLSVGDRIATPRVLPAFGNKRMNECDVKLLAYLIAEGHLSNQFVLFSNFDEKIVSDFKQGVAEFDSNLRIEEHSRPGCYRVAQVKKRVDLSCIVRDKVTGRFTDRGHIIFKKSSIRQWLEGVNLYGKLSPEKFIPKEIMQLERSQLSIFLNRLFSCDGSIYRINKGKNWAISIGFASERMTRDVQHLLLRFGILSTFRKKKTKLKGKMFDNFENVVHGENVLKFIGEIGFFGKKEERATVAFEEMSVQKRNPNLDTVPKEVWSNFRVQSGKDLSLKLGHNRHWFSSARSYSPSREKLSMIAEIEQNMGIKLLANSDIYWDTIKEIMEITGEKDVYDISVPMHHNFVANDIVVHNSYVLGVVAEELAEKNRNVGIIVVDPIGVFWSMRFPNKEEKEIEKLREWGLEPKGLNNIKVFVPEGIRSQVPKSTYDAGFTIQPSLLTGEDWALTFGVDRFSVSGLLLDKVIKKVEKGYRKMDSGEAGGAGGRGRGAKDSMVEGKGRNYSLEDLIECLESDSELNSREKGYKQDSIRAIISRFEAAKSWGIFSDKGTPLREFSKEGQLTVLDTSFLEDNVTALVIGILARRLLAARKISTRKEASNKFKSLTMEELLELEVPPTWLFIDEAHTLIPSGNEVTAATAGLVEYVKQGRRPGLSLVFATQQPSAINTKVLSQLDVIMSHKLIFDDDIKAVFKRTPTIIPRKYRAPNFIKTLPVGVALTGDRREETSRAFVMGVRPRKSQHEGRDAETTGLSETVEQGKVEEIAREMLVKRVKENGFVDMEMARLAIETLNSRYNAKLSPEKVIAGISAPGIIVTPEGIMKEGHRVTAPNAKKMEVLAEEEDEEEIIDELVKGEGERAQAEALGIHWKEGPVAVPPTSTHAIELLALPQRIDEQSARRIIEGMRVKKIFGFFGRSENLESLRLKYVPIWRVKFDAMTARKEFISRECFVNSMTGELIHFRNGHFLESRGLKQISEASDDEVDIMKALSRKEMLPEEVMAHAGIDEARALRLLQKLIDKKIVEKLTDKKSGKTVYFVRNRLDLPPNERHEMLSSLAELPFVRAEALSVEKEEFTREQAADAVRRLWNGVMIKRVEELYKPVWHAVLGTDGKIRNVLVDAVNGKIITA